MTIPYLGVSKKRGTPKWMVFYGKPYKNGWFGRKTPYFRKHPFGNYGSLDRFLSTISLGHSAISIPPVYPTVPTSPYMVRWLRNLAVLKEKLLSRTWNLINLQKIKSSKKSFTSNWSTGFLNHQLYFLFNQESVFAKPSRKIFRSTLGRFVKGWHLCKASRNGKCSLLSWQFCWYTPKV